MADGCCLRNKNKTLPYLSNGLADRHRPSELYRQLKFRTLKNPKMIDGHRLEKLKNGHNSCTYMVQLSSSVNEML